jgi:hypothetical protein
MVTYLRRNVTIVCGASYHLLGSRISQDLEIRFQLQVKSYISDWQFSESQHLARYVSRHNAMAYDSGAWLISINGARVMGIPDVHNIFWTLYQNVATTCALLFAHPKITHGLTNKSIPLL